MKSIHSFRLSLETHPEISAFRRLVWKEEPVSLRDVLLEGIHPWRGMDENGSLVRGILDRLNQPSALLPEVDEAGFCLDLHPVTVYGWEREKKTNLERTLEHVRQTVRFVDALPYLRLLELARNRLRDTWSHRIALDLAQTVYPDFQGLRKFLKTRDASVKLGGTADLANYDLGRILSIEDFATSDATLICKAVPCPNFRKASAVREITDAKGRLRLVERIDRVTFLQTRCAPKGASLSWHVQRQGELWRFRPDLGTDPRRRIAARDFAKQWRVDQGRLCFSTTIDRLVQITEEDAAEPVFPSLYYGTESEGSHASADVGTERIQSFRVGGHPHNGCQADVLRELLRRHGASVGGNKAELLARLAKVAAKRYAEEKPGFDDYFSKHRFIRCATALLAARPFPGLDGNGTTSEDPMRNLVLAVYCLRHLRGNAILDADYDNDACTEEEYALALLQRRTALTGVFLLAG